MPRLAWDEDGTATAEGTMAVREVNRALGLSGEKPRGLRLEAVYPPEFDSHRIARDLDIVPSLQREPPAVAQAEEAAQA